MKKEIKIPAELNSAANELAKKYYESEATTNGGVILRLLARFITLDTVLKVLANVIKK